MRKYYQMNRFTEEELLKLRALVDDITELEQLCSDKTEVDENGNEYIVGIEYDANEIDEQKDAILEFTKNFVKELLEKEG